jgi:hypothetical protein
MMDLTMADTTRRADSLEPLEPLIAEIAADLGEQAARDAADGAAGSPLAAAVLADVLRLTPRLDVEDGVVVESLAYSTLLAGPEFARWRDATPRRPVPPADEPVLVTRHDDELHVRLHRPERRNAWGTAVRDGVLDALEVARVDPSVQRVLLDGAGPAYCSGGDLDEFGTASDPVTAHRIRLSRHAGLAVHGLADRVRPLLHGACIGAGIEVPAFAAHVAARPDAVLRLPELSMGLIPGAGGTVSITRRIGVARTAWLALTGQPIDVATARDWGLVDEVVG